MLIAKLQDIGVTKKFMCGLVRSRLSCFGGIFAVVSLI
jgi:hypothetical protein